MKNVTQLEISMDTNERQRRYVEKQKASGNGSGIVFADAFLRGMRDIGYKSPAHALAELIDNSIQASSTKIDIRFGFHPANKSKTKPDELALIDNGAGMIPEMISYAVRWGGTDRENDRKGFGRYGYGLPSAVVSVAKRYTVYSKIEDGNWCAVTVDIEALANAANDATKTAKLLEPVAKNPPSWVLEVEGGVNVREMKSGTVIVLEDMDRLKKMPGWITAKPLQTKLLQHFGVIYRHWLTDRHLIVEGVEVIPVDPLFLMEHARFFDETPIRARRVDTRTIEVETERGTKGFIRVRASYLHPLFQHTEPKPDNLDRKGAKLNKRFDIMKAYNGFLVCREGRQIDYVTPRWAKFQNDDRNIKIEIDFDPELDEHFGVTTAKQQIVIDDDMWDRLEHSGKNGGALKDLVADMRNQFKKDLVNLKAQAGNKAAEDTPRPSEVAMEATEKFKARVARQSEKKDKEAEQNLKDKASEEAQAKGKPVEEVINELLEKTQKRKWLVEFRAIEEGPFFQPKRLGEQRRLIINTDHPFYSKVYNVTPQARDALEVVLFVLAEAELDAEGEGITFYKVARNSWSERLRHSLDYLISDESIRDRAAANSEQDEVASVAVDLGSE